MKYLVTGVLILALLICLCFYANREIGKRTEAVSAPLEEALSALRSGEMQKARAAISLAIDAWTKSDSVLASFVSHDHTNNITEELAQLPWTSPEELGQKIEGILQQIRGLAEMDKIVWKNIL